MYRQGLGDCFLLTFTVGGLEKHMLIDCGTLGATTTGIGLADVVADIRSTTNDHLDLMIATHEHWDHVRGFYDRVEEFKKIKVDHVWMAWTENPKDALAKKIASKKEDLGAALGYASQALAQSTNQQNREMGLAVRDILGFFRDEDVLGAAKFSESVNTAMNFVRTRKGAAVRFCKPGDGPFEESWLPGFRFYVLGPPYDEQALYDTGEKGSSELYGVAAGLSAGAQWCLAAAQGPQCVPVAGSDGAADVISAIPFDTRFQIKSDGPNAAHLFGGTYFSATESWRRVDEDWLSVASTLALQLDNATNNTSLALAIERMSDRKVLLFPADAQQGNWLSWHVDTLKWTVKDGSAKREVRAKDLLARTVFYKVGHHSSHNATAKAHGLELMDQEAELTSFIPVDRDVALGRNPPGSWKMPARKLYRRLLEKCQGRVVRSDVGWAEDAQKAANKKVEKEFVGIATAQEWTSWKATQAKANVRISNLYIDYELN